MKRDQHRIRRLVPFFLRAALGLVLVGLLGIAALWLYLRSTSSQSTLSRGEWSRLRERFAERAVVPEAPTEVAPVVDTSDPPPETESPETEPREPEPPTRPPLEPLAPEVLDRQLAEYTAVLSKGILELQPFRSSSTLSPDDATNPVRRVELVNINPAINSWYLLAVEWRDGRSTQHHLVNARPERQDLVLDPEHPYGITFEDSVGRRRCDLWTADGSSALTTAATTPYVALCDEEVALRLPVPGRRTTLEWATDFLRDNVWRGERLTVFVRQNLFRDTHLETAEVVDDATTVERDPEDAPLPALMDPRFAGAALGVGDLGLELDTEMEGQAVPGHWYRATAQPGVFVGVVRPDLLDPEIFTRHRDVVSALDEVEREALVFLVAFDLKQFEIGFALGTEHPRVTWSERVRPSVLDASLPGPDGIGTTEPLVRTGIVPRAIAARTVATFTGGFKRAHGAFRASELAERNHGTHYGFVESGAVLSKLQPGLSTVFALEDGSLDMKTWDDDDEVLLPRILFARQNGVPILEPDRNTGEPVPGRRVSQWTAGNWSGSQDQKLRTVRSGAALQETESGYFLIYAYFSSATPSAMARVFEAYSCRYAMLLDMNALEHTYLALYRPSSGNLQVQHLVRGMEVLDKAVDDQTLPRFLGFADNRDFFYVMRKEESDGAL